MMRTPAYLCLLLTCMLISCTPTQEKHEIDYTSYVNPFIGTDFTGNTYPGAQAPFGMVQLSPDNGLPGWDRISGYFYPDSTIAGFSHTHLSGTGAGDLYDISFMTVTLPYKEAEAPLATPVCCNAFPLPDPVIPNVALTPTYRLNFSVGA